MIGSVVISTRKRSRRSNEKKPWRPKSTKVATVGGTENDDLQLWIVPLVGRVRLEE